MTKAEKESLPCGGLRPGGEEKERVVCDYISGMTDQYCIHKFEEIYVPKSWDRY